MGEVSVCGRLIEKKKTKQKKKEKMDRPGEVGVLWPLGGF